MLKELTVEKDRAGTIKPGDLQKMACSRTEAVRPSVRMMTAARTVRGFLRTRHGPVLGGGSARRRRERLLEDPPTAEHTAASRF